MHIHYQNRVHLGDVFLYFLEALFRECGERIRLGRWLLLSCPSCDWGHLLNVSE